MGLKSACKYTTAMINLAVLDIILKSSDSIRFTFSKSVDLNFLLTAIRILPPRTQLLGKSVKPKDGKIFQP